MRTVIIAVSFVLFAFGVGLSEQAAVAVDGDCSAADATCTSSFCETQTNVTKLCKILIGGACTTGERKCVDSIVCAAPSCSCPASKVANSLNTKCVMLVGGNCTASDQCLTNGQCNATVSGACVCKPGYSIKDFTFCSGATGIVASALMVLFSVFFTSRLL